MNCVFNVVWCSWQSGLKIYQCSHVHRIQTIEKDWFETVNDEMEARQQRQLLSAGSYMYELFAISGNSNRRAGE